MEALHAEWHSLKSGVSSIQGCPLGCPYWGVALCVISKACTQTLSVFSVSSPSFASPPPPPPIPSFSSLSSSFFSLLSLLFFFSAPFFCSFRLLGRAVLRSNCQSFYLCKKNIANHETTWIKCSLIWTVTQLVWLKCLSLPLDNMAWPITLH